MSTLIELAEQHIRESESRLQHIDELMVKASQTPMEGPATGKTEALLRQIRIDRDRLAKDLDDLRSHPMGDGSEVVRRGEGLKDLCKAVGLQLEKALTAIFERDRT